MRRTIGLMDYYRTISGNGLMGYRANGVKLGLVLEVQYSPIIWCIIKCNPSDN